jgi:hypothetical protein
MSDAILPSCFPAAICHTATKHTNYWQGGSTSIAIPPASTSNIVGRHNKIGGITFSVPLELCSGPIFESSSIFNWRLVNLNIPAPRRQDPKQNGNFLESGLDHLNYISVTDGDSIPK